MKVTELDEANLSLPTLASFSQFKGGTSHNSTLEILSFLQFELLACTFDWNTVKAASAIPPEITKKIQPLPWPHLQQKSKLNPQKNPKYTQVPQLTQTAQWGSVHPALAKA